MEYIQNLIHITEGKSQFQTMNRRKQWDCMYLWMTHWMRRVVCGRKLLPILPAKTPIVGNKYAFKDHRHETEYSAFLSYMDCQKAWFWGVMPPKIEHAKSNVQPFVPSQRLICWYPNIKITGGSSFMTWTARGSKAPQYNKTAHILLYNRYHS